MKIYNFTKSGNDWYIELPEFIEKGGSIGDLQMVDGADKMLDIISENKETVSVFLSEEKFDGADVIYLLEICEPFIGGRNYILKHFEGKEINQKMWLCQVTEFVFGCLPQKVYVKNTNKSRK